MICFGEMNRHSLSKIKTDQLLQGERAVMFRVQMSPTGEMQANEIAANLNVAAPSITTLLNRLEKKGYILRSAGRQDRRAVIVSITQEGSEVLNRCMEQMKEHFSSLVVHLGARDASELLRLIQKTLSYYRVPNK